MSVPFNINFTGKVIRNNEKANTVFGVLIACAILSSTNGCVNMAPHGEAADTFAEANSTNTVIDIEQGKKQHMNEKAIHTQTVRIIYFPDCKMVSSGVGFFGDPNFKLFNEWFSKQTVLPGLYGYDFLSDCCGAGMQWMYIYDERMDVPEELKIIDFKGGYYAVITAIDQDGVSYKGAMAARDEYLKTHGLEFDDTRWQLGHILTGYTLAKEIFGRGQMDYWMPVKKTDNE